MGAVEDEGGRPVHRAREWQQAARRLDKETKTANWHKQNPDQIAAPLILNLTSGNLTKQKTSGISVTVRERAGVFVRSDSKSEPREKGCHRIDCLCCSRGKPGMCEKNSVGYRISSESCQGRGKWAHYKGENSRNGYSRGLEDQENLKYE